MNPTNAAPATPEAQAAQPPPTSSSPAIRPGAAGTGHLHGKELAAYVVAALGIVYGDIGTSPLYALRECFQGTHAILPGPQNVLGVLSLIFWSLVLIISVKYLVLILRADNRGEGGILALMALSLQKAGQAATLRRGIIIALGIFGAALLYGDGVITPAISVLSAMEGLTVASSAFQKLVIPLTVVTIVALFLFQRRGTAAVGKLFGPVMVVWFVVLGALGIVQIFRYPDVLWALNPWQGVQFFVVNRYHGFLVLGAVFLVVTGGEALYADMGHFGRRPIRVAWFSLVLPALLLNYFGQGALLLHDTKAVEHPFFHLAPSWALYPLVALSTAATIIASQAVISGAYSLTQQAVQLGYLPRIHIVHTSARVIGQIYIPFVNWGLLLAVLAVVLGFGSSSALAAAYGIAVTLTMVITTLLAYVVMTENWGWRKWVAVPVMLPLFLVSLAFFLATATKLGQGGWFPLAVGLIIYVLMTTWKSGRQILARRLRDQVFPLEYFLSSIAATPPVRVPGIAVFMTGNPDGTPPALLHNWKHNKVIHEKVVLLTVLAEDVPHVDRADRLTVAPLENGFYRVLARYGFMESPRIQNILKLCKEKGLEMRLMETSFFLGRETLIPTKQPAMALWREALFAWMSRNARPATSFFEIPPNRVVELGTQIEL